MAEIVDGETLKVRIEEGDDEGDVQIVRLIGIDTPEMRDPNDPVKCFGAEATKRLETMLPKGRTVYLEQDIFGYRPLQPQAPLRLVHGQTGRRAVLG